MSSPSNPGSSPPSSPIEPTGKLPIPYVVGASFIAKRHQPPPPLRGEGQSLEVDNVDHLNQLGWCILHPPKKGQTFPNDTYLITIKDIIRTGEDCGAQLLLTDTGLIAKIFDPLYYTFTEESFNRTLYLDVSARADSEYSTEVGAYSETRTSKVQGSIMPRYYGSWTLNTTHETYSGTQVREIRLILQEYVRGVRMLNLKPRNLSQDERENIMRKVIDADYDLRSAGIAHEDISPRNVILATDTDYADPNMRLTMVDYGICYIYRIHWGRPAPWSLHNPCFEWTCADSWSDWGWLPYDDEDRVHWIWKVWGDGMEGKYLKVDRDPDDSLGLPIQSSSIDACDNNGKKEDTERDGFQ